jgi:hypothetical protein
VTEGGARRRRRGHVSMRRQGERGKSGWRGSLPHWGASAVACGGKDAAERWRGERPKHGNGGGRIAWCVRVFRAGGGGCG